jgi:hypothetical protein
MLIGVQRESNTGAELEPHARGPASDERDLAITPLSNTSNVASR